MRLRTLAAWTFGLFLTLGASSAARAADPDVERAKTLFAAGEQAYSAGRFAVAAQAFSEAYASAPRPAILFSLAQAERRQFTAEHQIQYLQDALTHFRQYVAQVAHGGRRADAVEALAELEAAASRLDPAEKAAAASRERRSGTRIMVSTNVKGAAIAIDGKRNDDVPVIEEVAPGAHKVHVAAPGYFDEDRDVTSVAGYLVALEVPLRERPARLVLGIAHGAEVTIDGRPYGETPLAPLELPAGSHVVTLTKTGRRAFFGSVVLKRGESTNLAVDMHSTSQRTISYFVLGGSALALVTGAVFTGLALSKESSAMDIRDAASRGNIAPSDLTAYNHAIDSRDGFRTASYVSFGAAGALGLVGAALYFFDHPMPEQETAAPPRAQPAASKVTLTPVGFAGGGGAVLRGEL